MLRVSTLLMLLAVAASPAFACDMQATARSESLIAFAENGRDCLEFPPQGASFDAELEAKFLTALNRDRQSLGLDPLALREEMRPAARFHSLDMSVNRFFSHNSLSGRDHGDRLAAFDRTLLSNASSENLAQMGPVVCVNQDEIEVSCDGLVDLQEPKSEDIVRELHAKLMDSEGHRRNMLDPDATHMAVGVVRAGTGVYVAQVFADMVGELSEPLPMQVEAGETHRIKAALPGLTVKYYALEAGNERTQIRRNRIPNSMSGEAKLTVRAELVFEAQEDGGATMRVAWMYPIGPAVEIVPAKGS